MGRKYKLSKWTVADVIDDEWEGLISCGRYNRYQLRHLDAIRRCRTPSLGGHLYRCNQCKAYHKRYNSCRNRHCPTCQHTQQQKWVDARLAEVLPTTYYHVVFTLPHELNAYCLKYPRQMYGLLFKSSWETIHTLGWDRKYMGAQAGAVMVLHTWGQNLSLHPHVHCIVPGGGVTYNNRWQACRGSKGKYLFPQRVLAAVFRGKYVSGLKKILASQGEDYRSELHRSLYNQDWVVYCKPPFEGASGVIEYLSRYTHKVAISNHRIIDVNKHTVLIRYKDYRHGGKHKVMKLKKTEFIRRFSMHLLPKGFTRIRHYGILSGRLKKELLGLSLPMEKKKWDNYWQDKNVKIYKCPYCEKGQLILIDELPKRGPPYHRVRRKAHV